MDRRREIGTSRSMIGIDYVNNETDYLNIATTYRIHAFSVHAIGMNRAAFDTRSASLGRRRPKITPPAVSRASADTPRACPRRVM